MPSGKNIIIIMILLITRLGVSQIFDYKEDTVYAKFRIDLIHRPVVNGIYFLVLPNQYDGRIVVGSEYYENYFSEICSRNGYAFMSCSFDKFSIKDVFNRALAYFAVESQHPELLSVPVFWDGISGGTYLTIGLVYEEFPDRTIGYIISSGYAHPLGMDEGSEYMIPGLWVVGGLNTDGFLYKVSDLFYEFRKDGALWTLAVIPGMAHERADKNLVYDYLTDLKELRYVPDSEQSNSFGLIDLKVDMGWLGNNHHAEYYEFGEYIYTTEEASWLPGEQFAKTWSNLVDEPLTDEEIKNERKSRWQVSCKKDDHTTRIIINSDNHLHGFLRIIDLYGRIMDLQNLQGKYPIEISLYGCSANMYLIELRNDDYQEVRKIICR